METYPTVGSRSRELERRTVASNLRFWHALEPRCLGNNRRFRRVSAAGVSGHAVTDLDRPTLDALLANPDAPFQQPGVKLLKDSRSSTVVELELLVGGVPRRLIYKRFRVTSWADPWLALVRPTGALRSWVSGHALRLRWLPTPRPLLVLHLRRCGLVREGYLLTAKVEDAEDLHAQRDRLSTLPHQERQAAVRLLLGAWRGWCATCTSAACRTAISRRRTCWSCASRGTGRKVRPSPTITGP